MNEQHERLCRSEEWAGYLQGEVLPSVVGDRDLGAELVEVGPGPGASTAWLSDRVERLTAVEIDADAAAKLAERFADDAVEVVTADATELPFADASFDSAASFTMLHHLPTADAQNRLLAELLRVLRPGGVLVGGDSLHSVELHHFHEGDVYNPVEPASLLTRLLTLGYEEITLTVSHGLGFVAHKPDPEAPAWHGA